MIIESAVLDLLYVVGARSRNYRVIFCHRYTTHIAFSHHVTLYRQASIFSIAFDAKASSDRYSLLGSYIIV